MTLTDKQRERIKNFKAAFKFKAAEQNPKIRWGKPKRKWQNQSSLSEIDKSLEVFRNDPNPDTLKQVQKSIDNVPTDRKTKYKDALDELQRELAETVVEAEQILPGPPAIHKVRTGNGMFGFRTDDDKILAQDVSETRVNYAINVLGKLDELALQQGIEIDGKAGLLESIIKDPKMGLESEQVDGSIWAEAIKRVTDTVLPSIENDKQTLEKTGLVAKGAKLKGIKFTGSDFHKGGKQVLILRFDENGKEKKVAYKPSNLQVDALLFGKSGVAAKLEGISTYNIVPQKTDDDPPQDYGYMEYIDTEGGPKNAQDVLAVYASIASSMAMSYYVGLEDVHHENVKLKKKAIQVIDMEATTGTFRFPDKGREEMGGGFIDQQWDKAIGGFKASLLELIETDALQELPDDSVIKSEMVDAFSAVTSRLSDRDIQKDLDELEMALSKQRTRIVPIETAAFQTGIISFARADKYRINGEDKPATLENWVAFVDEKLKKEEEAGEGASVTFLGNARGQTSTPLPTLRNLLVSEGVWKALRRGDVPYYYRDLGSSDVYDEENNKISVPGHKKVGDNIVIEMFGRRVNTDLTAQALTLFQKQGVRLVEAMNKELRVALEKRQSR